MRGGGREGDEKTEGRLAATHPPYGRACPGRGEPRGTGTRYRKDCTSSITFSRVTTAPMP